MDQIQAIFDTNALDVRFGRMAVVCLFAIKCFRKLNLIIKMRFLETGSFYEVSTFLMGFQEVRSGLWLWTTKWSQNEQKWE